MTLLLCLFEQYLDNVKATVHEHLRNLINSPSVQMQDIPPDLLSLENTEEHDPDIRNHQDQTDKRSVQIELQMCFIMEYEVLALGVWGWEVCIYFLLTLYRENCELCRFYPTFSFFSVFVKECFGNRLDEIRLQVVYIF